MNKWLIPDQNPQNLGSLKKYNNKTVNKISSLPFLFLLAILFSVIQVIMLNRYSTIGDKLNKFDIEIRQIEGENITLAEKVASSSSIASISQNAARIGLVKTLDVASLSTPLPVAYNLHLQL